MLTRRWLSPRAWDIDVYEQLEGYQALRHALTGHPDQLIELVKDSGPARPRRRGLPDRHEVGLHPAGRHGPGAKPNYLVINADEGEPGTCKDIPTMMADPHSLIEGCIITCYAIRAKFCAIYVRGEALHPLRRVAQRGRRRPTRRATSAATSSAPGSTWTSWCTPAPAPTSAARRPRCSTRWRAAAASRGSSRRSRPSPGLYACPTVVNNVETIASVPAIVLGGSSTGSGRWAREKSPGPKIYSLSGHVTRPGQYEAPMGTTLRAAAGARPAA